MNDIVRSAQRSHRSHTAKLVGGSALALALVVGVGYAAVTGNGSDDAQPARLEHGEVKTIDKADLREARQLVAGKDYDILGELLAETANRDSERVGVVDGGWEPDDLLILWKDEGIVSVSGEDGTETRLGPYPRRAFIVLAAGDDHLVRGEVFGDLWVENLSSGDEHKLPTSVEGVDEFSGIEVQDVSIDSGRIWATVPAEGSDSDSFSRVVVSAPLDGSSGFRREVDAPVARAMVSDGTLAWVDKAGRLLMVRDLESGDEAEVVERTSADCGVVLTDVTTDRVAGRQACEGDKQFTTMVWSLDGGPTLVLDTLRLERGGLSGEMMIFRRHHADDMDTYVYRFDTGEMLHLGTVALNGDGRPMYWPTRVSGDRLVFPSPDRKGRLALVALK